MKKIKIVFTSDTHGHLFPENYTAKCKEDSGLLNIAHQIEKDGNTLVLDGGDTLQGTPLGDKKYRLVMNNYRASGTGGYQIFETCPVLWCGEKEMPELIADYIRKNSPVEVKQQKTAALEVMLTEIKFGEELKN